MAVRLLERIAVLMVVVALRLLARLGTLSQGLLSLLETRAQARDYSELGQVTHASLGRSCEETKTQAIISWPVLPRARSQR